MGCSTAAGKTGTSEELSDAWFVGFTPLFSTAVWVGHPTSREYTGFGGPTAGPIWANYMSEAVEGDCPEFEPAQPPTSKASTATTPLRVGYNSYEEEESYEGEEEESEDEGKGKGGDEGGEENSPEPEPTPEPDTDPAPDSRPRPPGGGLSPG